MSKQRSLSLILSVIGLLVDLPSSKSDDNDDLCDPNPCRNGGTCIEVVLLEGNTASCSCVGGSDGKDKYCNEMLNNKPADRCSSNPCEGGGICYPDPYGEWSYLRFVCVCDTDREGDRCEIPTGRPKGESRIK